MGAVTLKVPDLVGFVVEAGKVETFQRLRSEKVGQQHFWTGVRFSSLPPIKKTTSPKV